MKFHAQHGHIEIYYDDSKSPWIEITESNSPPIRIGEDELGPVIDQLTNLYQQLRELEEVQEHA
jgi:hypothetical protein